MSAYRTFTALVLGLGSACAIAQTQGGMRWPAGSPSVGLQAGNPTLRVPIAEDIGVYGRFGTVTRPAMPAQLGASEGTGLRYGVGLSWDFSPRASATLGWENHDLRGATSLGLQWRY